MLPQSDVAVRVDEAGHDPAAVKDRVGVADRLGAQCPVDDPPLHRLAIGQPDGREHEDVFAGARIAAVLAGELQLRQVDVGQAGRQLVETLRHVGQIREAGGHAGFPGPKRIRAFGGVGPRPPFLPFFLFLAALREEPLRPNGIPIWPAICDIILRASKNRSTS